MDLTTAVVNFQQAKTVSAAQAIVVRKMLDAQQFQGAVVVKLIGAAGRTAAKAGDALVAASTGLGAEIDTYA